MSTVNLPVPTPPTPPPGYQSTEFWLTLVKILFAALITTGVVHTSDQASLQGAAETAVTAVFALVMAGRTIEAYIVSRTTVKTAHIAAQQTRNGT
jgi:hypothetical protein